MRRILARADAVIDWTSYYESMDAEQYGGHIHRNPADWRNTWVSLVVGGQPGGHVAGMRALRVAYVPSIADDYSLTAQINARSTVTRGDWPALRWGRALAVRQSRDVASVGEAQVAAYTPVVDLGSTFFGVRAVDIIVHVTALRRTDGGTPSVQFTLQHGSGRGAVDTDVGSASSPASVRGPTALEFVPYAGAGIMLNRYVRLKFSGDYHHAEFTAAMFWRPQEMMASTSHLLWQGHRLAWQGSPLAWGV